MTPGRGKMMMMAARIPGGRISRRGVLAAGAGAVGLALSRRAAADQAAVAIALIAPLSGDWAEHGVLMREGAQFAIDQINAQGGIAALGGARLQLVVADTGSSVETAVSAAQRVLGGGKVSAALGCWLSSFTLGATEIAERVRVPWLTFSYADRLTSRGYRYTFRDNAPSSVQIPQALKLITEASAREGKPMRTIGIVGDNTAASQAAYGIVRKVAPQFGLTLVVEQVWTPPLANPDAIADAIKAAQPDLIHAAATSFSDTAGLIQAMRAHEVKTAVLGAGSQFLTPEFVKAVGGGDKLTGLATIVGDGVLKGMEQLSAGYEKQYGHPMIEDSAEAYAETWIIKEALEAARSADPQKLRDALAGLHLTQGPATFLPGGEVQFDSTGQNVKASVAIQQWQGGRIVTVAPENAATGRLIPLQ